MLFSNLHISNLQSPESRGVDQFPSRRISDCLEAGAGGFDVRLRFDPFCRSD